MYLRVINGKNSRMQTTVKPYSFFDIIENDIGQFSAVYALVFTDDAIPEEVEDLL